MNRHEEIQHSAIVAMRPFIEDVSKRLDRLERAILDLAQYVTDTPHPRHELKSEAIDRIKEDLDETAKN